jgi:hypothetical protein
MPWLACLRRVWPLQLCPPILFCWGCSQPAGTLVFTHLGTYRSWPRVRDIHGHAPGESERSCEGPAACRSRQELQACRHRKPRIVRRAQRLQARPGVCDREVPKAGHHIRYKCITLHSEVGQYGHINCYRWTARAAARACVRCPFLPWISSTGINMGCARTVEVMWAIVMQVAMQLQQN